MPENIKTIVIGGSAGSFNVVRKILAALPSGFQLPVFLCLHRLRDVRNGFAESLNLISRMPVIEPLDKTPVEPGYVYLSPANYHMLVEPSNSIALSIEPEVNYSRPSIDMTFMTSSFTYGKHMAGILLSGTNSDGAKGLHYAYMKGSLTLIQDPVTAQFGTMPGEALKYFKPHMILAEDEIITFIINLKNNIYA